MVASHVRLWLIGLFLSILIVPALVTSQWAVGRIRDEIAATARIFGPTRAKELVASASTAYSNFPGALHVQSTLSLGMTSEREHQRMVVLAGASTTMGNRVNQYLETIQLLLFGVVFRGYLMSIWMLYLGAFVLAAIIDGLVQRRVKKETMALNSPLPFAWALHSVIVIAFTPLAYLLLPFSVTPWFMPMWCLLMALPLAKAIANAVRMG